VDGTQRESGHEGQREELATELLRRARRVVALTGAGISTDSGIPDFRGPKGVWTTNPGAERLATLQTYVDDAELRRAAWARRLASGPPAAAPNAGHLALAAFERSGRLDLVVTQNVDGLHQLAGTDPSRIVEIHGTMHEVTCLRCDDRQPMAAVLERVRSGDDDPRCRRPGCGGLLKSATISFGQALVERDLRRAEQAASACDLLLCVGTTLGVYPAAGLVPIAVRAGATLVVVNAQPTPFDHLASVVLRRPISAVLPVILAAPG
jgi:NAD-dependent deacetylase